MLQAMFTNTHAVHLQFRYADKWDILLTVLGQFVAVCHGALMILRIVIYGDMADMFIDDATFSNWLDENWHNITAIYPNASKEEIIDDPGGNLWCVSLYIQADRQILCV